MTPEQKRAPGFALEVLGGIALLTFSGENLAGIILGLVMVGDGLTGSHVVRFMGEKLAELDGNTPE